MKALSLCLLQYLDLRDANRLVHLQILLNSHYTAYTKEVTKNGAYRKTCFCLPTVEEQKQAIGKILSWDCTWLRAWQKWSEYLSFIILLPTLALVSVVEPPSCHLPLVLAEAPSWKIQSRTATRPHHMSEATVVRRAFCQSLPQSLTFICKRGVKPCGFHTLKIHVVCLCTVLPK
jgi:hypothetical protein